MIVHYLVVSSFAADITLNVRKLQVDQRDFYQYLNVCSTIYMLILNNLRSKRKLSRYLLWHGS